MFSIFTLFLYKTDEVIRDFFFVILLMYFVDVQTYIENKSETKKTKQKRGSNVSQNYEEVDFDTVLIAN